MDMTHAELLEMVGEELRNCHDLVGVEVAPGRTAYCIVSASASVYGPLDTVKVVVVMYGLGDGPPLQYTWEAHTGGGLAEAIPSIRTALCGSAYAYGTLAALERIAAAWVR